ncbi:radical SAM protein [Natranaerobius thermophilus]|uniref:Radical SAM domain protein n=1 Tax=Natranaerobius thermophilus (strain ATCC BAA-1301 / DSM 18059 / JW/NM-WN-LF) TaxID=457570 RepID=B2A201_NATTJ|nr:radical SAM protein [Natranaerobius thermophilus]ACB84806.1 Radical SAM domain protein [Natranaerobius thermophilus JW/NM-WN-LF]
MSFVYGPVKSRRLGLSLGVDITPDRICSFDCIYCEEACATKTLTITRSEYSPTETVINEIVTQANNHPRLDYITFSGSGEPTLHSELGKIITEIKSQTDNAVAVLTNSSLLYREDVRNDLQKSDLVVPSIDAITEKSFTDINRPHEEINSSLIVNGIKTFCQEYTGKIYLEILLVSEVNDSYEEIEKLANFVNDLNVTKIHLNTVSRATTEPDAQNIPYDKLKEIVNLFSKPVEIFN